MTRFKCDNCGEIKEIGYEFNRMGWCGAGFNYTLKFGWCGAEFNYTLKFCYDCGLKIEKLLKAGVN